MATNYTALLWLFEVKAEEPAVLLYGFAAPSERALTPAWRSFKLLEKFTRLPFRKGVQPMLYRLTRVMSRTEVDRFFESLGLGSIDLTVSGSRRQPFSIRGQWFLRQATEAPLAALNSYDIKLTNLSGSGAAVRRTAWRLHWDVLGEYCLTFSDKTELAEIQASDGYRELLVALGKDVGLHFLGDDFLQLGNFDIYNGRIDESPEVHGLIGDVITQGDPPEVIGFDVRVPEALLRKLGPLIVKVELHSRFDRTFCKIFRLAADANGLIPVRLGDLEPFCSSRIEVFREDTGDLVTQEARDLIRASDISLKAVEALRTIDTPWSQQQKRTRPGQQAASSPLITLNTTRQISMPTLRRDFSKDPWNFLANKLAQTRPILAESQEDALLPEIADPNETNRTPPLVCLLNTVAYTNAEIFGLFSDSS